MVHDALAATTELSREEAELIEGGSYVQVAAYLTACFKAGFYFGFTELGPMLF